MSLIIFKLIAALSILLLAICSGLLPLRFALRNKRIFHLGDAFASGIFLSVSLLHFLPDAERGFNNIYGIDTYPWAKLICVIAFVFLLLMEHGISMYGKYRAKIHNTHASDEVCSCHKNLLTPFLLLFVLSIHSFVEGAAIGISTGYAAAFITYLAVIVHKGSETLALTSNLYRYSLKLKYIVRLIIVFAFMTPLGIFFASLINNVIDNSLGQVLEAIFNAFAAGTFLYLGSVHIMECEKSFEDFGEITALILGVLLMSVVAVWV